jgi:hypothetical protein
MPPSTGLIEATPQDYVDSSTWQMVTTSPHCSRYDAQIKRHLEHVQYPGQALAHVMNNSNTNPDILSPWRARIRHPD